MVITLITIINCKQKMPCVVSEFLVNGSVKIGSCRILDLEGSWRILLRRANSGRFPTSGAWGRTPTLSLGTILLHSCETPNSSYFFFRFTDLVMVIFSHFSHSGHTVLWNLSTQGQTVFYKYREGTEKSNKKITLRRSPPHQHLQNVALYLFIRAHFVSVGIGEE